MVGVLLQDRVSGGHAPTVEVLSIGSTRTVRQVNDLLPYLPRLRWRFAALPLKIAELNFKPLKVAINDIEAVTKSILKVIGQTCEPLR